MDVYSLKLTNFTIMICAFLVVITHRVLLDCFSADSYAGYLYSFIGGSSDSSVIRLIPSFQQVYTSFTKKPSSAFTAAGTLEEPFPIVATTLRKTLPRIVRALVNDQFPELMEPLRDVRDTVKLVSELAAYSLVDCGFDNVRRL